MAKKIATIFPLWLILFCPFAVENAQDASAKRTIYETGQPTHFVVIGDGYLKVKDKAGNSFYCRSGEIVLNDQRQLCVGSENEFYVIEPAISLSFGDRPKNMIVNPRGDISVVSGLYHSILASTIGTFSLYKVEDVIAAENDGPCLFAPQKATSIEKCTFGKTNSTYLMQGWKEREDRRAVSETGQVDDIAVIGKGYVLVKNDDGKSFYCQSGKIALNMEGKLCIKHEQELLIIDPEMTVPFPVLPNHIFVSPEGHVSVIAGLYLDLQEVKIGRVDLYRLLSEHGLKQAGNGIFQMEKEIVPIKEEFGETTSAFLMQGWIDTDKR